MAANKNIVICSDGTGNTAIKGRGINVFKIFEAVDIYGHWIDRTLRPQVAIYDDGVGTESFKPLSLEEPSALDSVAISVSFIRSLCGFMNLR